MYLHFLNRKLILNYEFLLVFKRRYLVKKHKDGSHYGVYTDDKKRHAVTRIKILQFQTLGESFV